MIMENDRVVYYAYNDPTKKCLGLGLAVIAGDQDSVCEDDAVLYETSAIIPPVSRYVIVGLSRGRPLQVSMMGID